MAKAKIKRLYLIPILSKALDVIELLEQDNSPLSLEDVYQRTKISKTSVYRILKTLVHRGYLAQTPSGQYRLVSRPRRLRFGFAVQSAEMPFSEAVAQSVTAAAAASGVELLMLDNRYDPHVAVSNAEEFVAKRVDLVLEFQVEEAAAPRVAHIFKKADIPLVAIDVPHPNATYFGVDNFEVGSEAASVLAQYAQRKWKSKVDRVVGVGFSEAGSFVQNRITGAFDGIRERFKELTPDRFVQIDGRGMREASRKAMSELLGRGRPGEHVLVAAANDTSALGVLDAVREAGQEANFAIVGQDCIPEALEEMHKGTSAIVGSISHEPETYGPRLIQLGISILRGYTVPPYNYVHHRAVTPETLGAEEKAHNAKRKEAAQAVAVEEPA
ncbi:putative sugar uptake ABC transporter, solute-binding protein [Candidatus Sulfotelmatomonas gaucii]|uniref:Putative sugar uptake ABC transporter, solute-binding protein n=1 Tax=Candidatus Sulfuritelmatomonas gaucii TaxID=2043161 RepID=A0A2N9L862_9BACT|nr:putative sugar uptake ABC transporter, solute-binding protein [Candidatus Sulfotelmatomonas gaucii]